MKFSSQEEYGLRCLIQIARHNDSGGLSIPQVSAAEGLSIAHVAKLLRILRIGGYIESTRGYDGGYRLARPAQEINISDVLKTLGGKLFEDDFCERHPGTEVLFCAHTPSCAVRSIWQNIQSAVDKVLQHLTLNDLLSPENPVHTIDKVKPVPIAFPA
jgi:Rrf2 family protein